MPFRTAIRWLHRLVTVALLIVVAGFVWLNHQSAPRGGDVLQRTYKLSDSVWLYMTVNDQGGATMPTIYRYYLSHEIAAKDTDVIKQLATKQPILEGTGSITEAFIDKNGEVSIAYSGQVFSVHQDVRNLRFTVKP